MSGDWVERELVKTRNRNKHHLRPVVENCSDFYPTNFLEPQRRSEKAIRSRNLVNNRTIESAVLDHCLEQRMDELLEGYDDIG